MKNLLALLLGLVFALLVLEAVLQVWTPFPFSIRGNEIRLLKDRVTLTPNPRIPGTDTVVVYRHNNMGLRGPDLTQDAFSKLRIIAIGGSTTGCRLLSEGADWPAMVSTILDGCCTATWVNNAGIDGLSTLGCTVMLNHVAAATRPDMVLLLAGRNEMGQEGLTYPQFIGIVEGRTAKPLLHHSEVYNLLVNLANYRRSVGKGFRHFHMDPLHADTLVLAENAMQQVVGRITAQQLEGYSQRLRYFIATCRKTGAEPVLITQPTPLGDLTEPALHTYMGHIKVSEAENGILFDRALTLFNEVTLRVADETGTFAIDLAGEMPKRMEYFYDHVHFSKAGSAKVAEIVSTHLAEHLRAQGECRDSTSVP
ncbi:MAG: SGNH/GDSL hydrolase family protein [Flavobacteriales bacterium]|nr:SGNH/GDSL hydrolase family protein [Flavobacteriales bacterium]